MTAALLLLTGIALLAFGPSPSGPRIITAFVLLSAALHTLAFS